MKVCIVGAGAVGGLIGARLAASGAAVSALARGETLAALRTHGWRLKQGDKLLSAPASALSSDARELGLQDLVIVAVKAPVMAALANVRGAAARTLDHRAARDERRAVVVLRGPGGLAGQRCRRRSGRRDRRGDSRSHTSSAASCIVSCRDRRARASCVHKQRHGPDHRRAGRRNVERARQARCTSCSTSGLRRRPRRRRSSATSGTSCGAT